MGETGAKLRRTTQGIAHWCPACEETHHYQLKGSPAWTFDGNVASPSFTPSMRIRWGKAADPNWPEEGGVCHYFLTAGVLNYCSDSTHALAGESVPLPDWPYAPGTYGGIDE